MKIRNGFVSNSSSSSFIISVKNGVEFNEQLLLRAFGIGEDSVLYNLAVEMAKALIRNSEEASYKSFKEAVEELTEEDFNFYAKEKSLGNKVYFGSVSDQSFDGSDYGAEFALVQVGLNYESDELKIFKEEGY
jgi:plasmid replication initiation protein